MVIVITGGRDYRDAQLVRMIAARCATKYAVYVGDCPSGVDAYARAAVPDARIFRADWGRWGRAAGPRRNRDMCAAAAAAGGGALIAFPGGRGTRNCREQAIRYGLRVIDIPARG